MSLDNDAQIETIDRNHSLGRLVYVRSLSEDRSGAVAEKRELCLFLRVDVTALHAYTKANGLSFYHSMVWLVTQAVNETENLRYTLRGGEVYLLPARTPSFTELKKGSEQFLILTVPWDPSLPAFCRAANEKSERQTAFLESASETDDLVYLSCLPWFDLTCCTNERNFDKDDAIPRITWGKYVRQGGRETLGLSIEVNHRFVDGVHLGRFYEALQQKINDLE